MEAESHSNLAPNFKELAWTLDDKPFYVLWLRSSFKTGLDFHQSLPKILQTADVSLGPKNIN